MRYRPVAVFNTADLEGEALAPLLEARQTQQAGTRRSAPERLQRADAVLGAWPVPMLLGDRLDIGSDSRNHAAYLQHWITLLHRTPRLLHQVQSEARRAADLISAEDAADPA